MSHLYITRLKLLQEVVGASSMSLALSRSFCKDEKACEMALSCLEEQIVAEGPGTIAAIMLESIPGSAGVLIPAVGFVEGVRALCDQYELLMICDEVMTGFGRTGEMFAFQHFDGASEAWRCDV